MSSQDDSSSTLSTKKNSQDVHQPRLGICFNMSNVFCAKKGLGQACTLYLHLAFVYAPESEWEHCNFFWSNAPPSPKLAFPGPKKAQIPKRKWLSLKRPKPKAAFFSGEAFFFHADLDSRELRAILPDWFNHARSTAICHSGTAPVNIFRRLFLEKRHFFNGPPYLDLIHPKTSQWPDVCYRGVIFGATNGDQASFFSWKWACVLQCRVPKPSTH